MTPDPTAAAPDPSVREGAPWWRHGMVWLVIAGPASVVLAAIPTIWLALSRPDPVITPDYYRRGIEINKVLERQDKALLPAVQGRNHAATPARP
jgi:hypothetical protein